MNMNRSRVTVISEASSTLMNTFLEINGKIDWTTIEKVLAITARENTSVHFTGLRPMWPLEFNSAVPAWDINSGFNFCDFVLPVTILCLVPLCPWSGTNYQIFSLRSFLFMALDSKIPEAPVIALRAHSWSVLETRRSVVIWDPSQLWATIN